MENFARRLHPKPPRRAFTGKFLTFILKALAFFVTVLVHVIAHIALENALHPVLHGIGA